MPRDEWMKVLRPFLVVAAFWVLLAWAFGLVSESAVWRWFVFLACVFSWTLWVSWRATCEAWRLANVRREGEEGVDDGCS